ncbi:MAG: peroxiredoxin family protein [Gemmataceae bacterium]|nr:peroxiredoxin family protein [Gemmataceae bacterium]
MLRLATATKGLLAAVFATVAVGASAAAEKPPAVGDQAKDFELTALGGDAVKLSKLTEAGPVVLVVLRGYPGYQCPLCTRQAGEFLGKADEFKAAGAKVVLVYPGPAEKLKERAGEFVKGKDYPDHFQLLLDPDYTFTTAYGLRWDAKNETAYPATFVLDGKRAVRFAKVSTGHGDRAKVADVLKALAAK